MNEVYDFYVPSQNEKKTKNREENQNNQILSKPLNSVKQN